VKREEQPVYQYLRHNKKFPNLWCPGCGIGIVLGSLIRAIDQVGYEKDEVALVSGIGCTGRMPVYADFNTMHTTHGRAVAFATGLKLFRPDMHVVVVMGDGDAVAIGGNHFIHAARRNIDLTCIIVNNGTYGMTGGQYSPTTPIGKLSATAPYGTIEQPLPICDLAAAAGAAYVARSTVYHVQEMDKLIAEGLQKKGFSVVEVVSYCHTTYGRMNKQGGAVEMMRRLKEDSVSLAAAEKLSPDERAQKIVRGKVLDRDIPEYGERYDQIIAEAQRQAESAKANESLSAAPKKAPVRAAKSQDDSRFEIRLAGEGGQGLILAGLILSEAATIYDGKNATQTQSYGAEQRGGASRSEVIISDGEIDFPKVISADLLLAMSQEACDKYFRETKADGIVIVDSDHVTRVPTTRAIKVAITELAEQATGRAITANIVALGLIVGLTDVVSREAVRQSVLARAPRGTEEMNLKALDAGYTVAQNIRVEVGHKWG
jgi:2-oxoglutarate/2-oxoacid ferredoxin oxidoreductase subunit beta